MSTEKPFISFEANQTYHADVYRDGSLFKIHIVSVIDEGYGIQVVYRFFGKHKQWWHYRIEDQMSLDYRITGIIKKPINVQES